ncbi:branched-chain amino acid ABC transporter ATP-binding protein/permease [Nocardioides sp. L-11A]|uniref:branched-chain amino acid ABC transporter ATP-binding protein/permease n=1 Tax=Nocardioides sp. L-11A TaxID=3043848 RepID=UPI00249B565D|nr:branched-chain amino acid ABC transporter ATP-binding protein/permease [Nocardioides sp. L-11A]
MYFLSAFGAYDFLIRDSLILILVGASIYLLFNAGFFAVPQIGFMAIGAYTAALASQKWELPLALTLTSALVVGALFGLVLGLALFRLNGVYLAIATVGFSEMVRVTIRNLEVTGGPTGLVGIDLSLNDLHILLIVLVVFVGLALLRRTRHGSAMVAIREDPLMAAHQGISVRRYRVMLFIGSGALAGLAGGMRVHLTGFVEPSAFSFDLLSDILAATVVGGMTVVAGPLVGGALIFGLAEVLREFQAYRHMVNGALIVLIVAFAPAGALLLVKDSIVKVLRRVKLLPPPASTSVFDHDRAVSDVAVAPVASREPARYTSLPILAVEDLAKNFGGVKAVQNVDLEVYEGEVLGIIGPNGSGKTTVLNLLSGVYVPDSGRGKLAGTAVDHLWGRPEKLMRRGLSRTFQNIRLLDGCSVAENVRVGAYLDSAHDPLAHRLGLTSWSSEGRHLVGSDEAVSLAMSRVGISHIASLDVAALPYGLKRKVEIARALVAQPKLLLLDEPTAGMSPAERDDIFAVVESLRAEGVSVVIVEHDVSSMVRHCDRIVVLNFGKVIAVGDPEEVTSSKEVIDAYIGDVAHA